ncbi:LysE family translocator [Nocardiopsis terrae]
MPPVANVAAFALTALVLVLVPGPSVLFVIGRSLSLGRLGGFLSVLGNALGMLPVIAAVSLGVGAIVAESLVVLTAVKLVGAAYLVHLGVQAIRHRNARTGADEAAVPRTPPSRVLREGFVVGATNPKTVVFLSAVLPQFVSYGAGAIPVQLALLGLVFVAVALAGDTVWALAAGTARSWFARDPGRLAHMGAGGGVMMIGLGGALALSGSRN